ncbi:MAG: EAL domain-containing protein, partial [Sulfurimonadaceae bacterium]
EDEKLIRAIINTAEQFDYQIIAEGIEEETQREILKEINPSLYYQGYLAAKPLSAEAFVDFVTSKEHEALLQGNGES